MIARQTWALLALLGRNWLRRARRPGEAPKRGFPSTFLLNLAVLAFFLPQVWRIADKVRQLGTLRLVGMEVGIWGLFLLNAGGALALLAPELGKLRSPLRHTLLDELPVSPFSIMIVTWFQGIQYALLSGVYLVGISRTPGFSQADLRFILGFALVFSVTACAVGMAIVSLVRATLHAHQRRYAVWVSVAALLCGMLGVLVSPHVGAYAWQPPYDPQRGLAGALLGAHRLAALFALAGIGTLAIGVTALLESRGYDRIDSATPGPPRYLAPALLDMDGVERLLFSRESGRRVIFIMSVVGAVSVWSMAKSLHNPIVIRVLALQVAYMAVLFALQFSAAMVRRDLAARPFLSGLPITPHQTLEGKSRALRARLAPIVLLAVPLAWLSLPSLGAFEVIWRFASFCLAIWLLCGAAVPVAFLTNGLGAPSLFAMGASRSFATLLLSMPVLTTMLARNAVSALVSLGLLTAIGFEARRSALRCVHWIDDAGEVKRDTAVWRALLVLATFFSAQGLIAQLLSSFGVPRAWVLALTYGGASAVLGLLLHQQREQQPWPRFVPERKLSLLLGVAAGVVSAVVATCFVALVRRLGWAPDAGEPLQADGGAMWAVLFAIVLVAPLAEETFFRGWLQTAIASELSPENRPRAILYAALGFAAVHFGSLYVPQFVLGLLAGALYFTSGALLPGILAHAVHNGLATVLASYIQ